MTGIRTENLHKHYGTVKALDGLDLHVEAGKVYGFLGPNGAGKSTTIRLLTGLAKPTRGQAWVAGVRTGDQEKLARRIGYLPEEPAFYPWMTPKEFLDHVARIFGIAPVERQKRIGNILDQVGLTPVARRRISGFSRGMRQRLGLAQALINQPDVLLLDEPVSALDPAGRKEVLDMIQELRNQATVFMSTHILADIERVCDTVGIIHQGRMVVEAPKEDLLERYTVPAIELEVETSCKPAFRRWAETLANAEWVTSIAINGAIARVVVEDLDLARSRLLADLLQQDILLRRYEMVTPSLEDVFLRLVKMEAQQ